MTHAEITNTAWSTYLLGGSFIEEFRRLWRTYHEIR